MTEYTVNGGTQYAIAVQEMCSYKPWGALKGKRMRLTRGGTTVDLAIVVDGVEWPNGSGGGG